MTLVERNENKLFNTYILNYVFSRKQAAEPAIQARMATSEMWPRLEGAMKLSAPIWTPIEAGSENPHSA